MFIEACDNLDELTDTISEYVNFCTETLIPTKEIKMYSNSKHWITKSVKDIINRKKWNFKNGNPQELKLINRELKRAIRAEKENY